MENMIFLGDKKQYASELQSNVGLGNVSGGTKTNPAWTSEIANDAFTDAVKESLKAQGLHAVNGKYRLEVEMLKVDQPLFGLNIEVTTHVRYTLTNASSGSVVLNDVVITPHKVGMSDAIVASKRLRLANEGSATKNIEGLLNKLSELEVAVEEVSLAK